MGFGSNWVIIRFCPPCPIYLAHCEMADLLAHKMITLS